jgi:hypothetical protein
MSAQIGIDLGWFVSRVVLLAGQGIPRPLPDVNLPGSFATLSVTAYWEVDGYPVNGALVGQSALDLVADPPMKLKVSHALASAGRGESIALSLLLAKLRRDVVSAGAREPEVVIAVDPLVNDNILAAAAAKAGFDKAFRMDRAAACLEHHFWLQKQEPASISKSLVFEAGPHCRVATLFYGSRCVAEGRSQQFFKQGEGSQTTSTEIFRDFVRLLPFSNPDQSLDAHGLQEIWSQYRAIETPIISIASGNTLSISKDSLRAKIVAMLSSDLQDCTKEIGRTISQEIDSSSLDRVLVFGAFSREAALLFKSEVFIAPEVAVAIGAGRARSNILRLDATVPTSNERLDAFPINEGSFDHQVLDDDGRRKEAPAKDPAKWWDLLLTPSEVQRLRGSETGDKGQLLVELIGRRAAIVYAAADTAPTAHLRTVYRSQAEMIGQLSHESLLSFASEMNVSSESAKQFVDVVNATRTGSHNLPTPFESDVTSRPTEGLCVLSTTSGRSVEIEGLGISVKESLIVHTDTFSVAKSEARLKIEKNDLSIDGKKGHARPTYVISARRDLRQLLKRVLDFFGPTAISRVGFGAVYAIVVAAAVGAIWPEIGAMIRGPVPRIIDEATATLDASPSIVGMSNSPVSDAKIWNSKSPGSRSIPSPFDQVAHESTGYNVDGVFVPLIPWICYHFPEDYCRAELNVHMSPVLLRNKIGDCHTFYALIVSDPIVPDIQDSINLWSISEEEDLAASRQDCRLYSKNGANLEPSISKGYLAEQKVGWNVLPGMNGPKDFILRRAATANKVYLQTIGQFSFTNYGLWWRLRVVIPESGYKDIPNCVDVAILIQVFSKDRALDDADLDRLMSNKPFDKFQYLRIYKGDEDSQFAKFWNLHTFKRPSNGALMERHPFAPLQTPASRTVYLSGSCPQFG